MFVAGVPADLPGAILVVLHVPPDATSHLPELLSRAGALPACHPRNDQRLRAGEIYVAPPDHHLLVRDDGVVLTKGPKENRFRPSIDALFRSAAYNHRERVIGVVLSGALDDGTAGLWTVKHLGGTTIIQDPGDAKFDSMPVNARRQVQIDHCLPASEIGPLIGRLASSNSEPAGEGAKPAELYKIKTEVKIAGTANAFQEGIMDIGELTPFTCPECHGVLVRLKEGKMTRFRCHTGHGYSASALLAGITEAVGGSLWEVTRALEESVMLLNHLAKHFADLGDAQIAERFEEKARETEERAKVLQRLTLGHEHLSQEKIQRGTNH
jgi:two-component system chemotaxis response regulator CheB